MFDIILKFNWISCLLVFFVGFLVLNDKAFSKKIRNSFHIALVLAFLMSFISQVIELSGIQTDSFIFEVALIIQSMIRPLIILLLIFATDVCNKIADILVVIPFILDVVFIFAKNTNGIVAMFFIYIVIFAIALLIKYKNGDIADIFFVISTILLVITSALSEFRLDNINILNTALCLVICIFYTYMVMRTYKKDGLTGLYLRHSLKFEMKDLEKKAYDIVLIDVDNFKLINDKYGHDKGDEALITIVNTVLKHLPGGCRMYRFGGDEFVIISRRVPSSKIVEKLEYANSDLVMKDLHISFGVVKHQPGEDGMLALTEADKVMYENKRKLKSEDIWDDMTGLYNYRGFLDEVEILKNSANREDHIVCLLGIDIEKLSNINMGYGHGEGNLVISTLARILKTCLRGRDFIGHLGSDEFAVAIECEGLDDPYVAEFIDKVKEGMNSAFELSNKDYSVKLNIAKYYVERNNKDSAEDNINSVLYVKQTDKDNRNKTDSNSDEHDYDKQEEETVLDILDNNRLKYAFQPIISAKDGSVVAYESLMRSDTDVMISPLKILKYAERNKRTYDVENLTFFNVLSEIKKNNLISSDKRIFINSMPGYFLNDRDFDDLGEKYGDLFGRLVVEITEQREMDDEALALLNLRRDRGGFSLAIDDYGSGCSNTNSLLRYMPQIVKLDRLLITGIDRNAKKQFFVNSIITFARENDMQILAEGVETISELKTVIRLGVDMIQGYVTAKPSFDIIEEIDANIKKIIIDENLKVGGNQRMIYTASNNCELSVVHLAMEDYSKINVSCDYITITGNSEYTADMVVKIKDGTTCHMTLSDVRLNSVDDEPCIDLGENVNLTLNIEGHNRLNAKGIHVPESSSLTLIGSGNIEIYVKGHQCYAVGTDTESVFGSIILKNSGCVDINVDGEECVGIGGGITGENSAVEIRSGSYKMNFACVNAVGIGAHKGDAAIVVKDCEIVSNFRVNEGCFIGNIDGKQNIEVRNFNIELSGSGTNISGIGSVNETSGNVIIHSGTYKAKMNGHNIYLVGCAGGDLNIDITHTRLDLIGEGDNVLGFGSRDKLSFIAVHHCSMDMVINASNPLGFGTDKNEVKFEGPLAVVKINGEQYTVRGV